MKNNTKVRLRLSKQLFESLSKQIIAETKNMSGGAYTEAVKQPKMPKQTKSQAAFSEVQKTDKEAMMEKTSSKEKTEKVTVNITALSEEDQDKVRNFIKSRLKS